jgi:hypothetical protein
MSFDRKKQLTMERRMLSFLKARGKEGATNSELSSISLNFTSITSTLVKKGNVIKCKKMGDTDTWRYWLLKEATTEKYYMSAFEEMLFNFNHKFHGHIEGEDQFRTIFKLSHCVPHREHGFYKMMMKAEYQQFEEDEQLQFDLD